jgi:hypothetical protein
MLDPELFAVAAQVLCVAKLPIMVSYFGESGDLRKVRPGDDHD